MPLLPIYPAPSGRIAFHPVYVHPLPEGHRFPMLKYELIPQALLREGIATENDFFAPTELEEEVLLLTLTMQYWQKLRDLGLNEREMRAIGFPLSGALIRRTRSIAKGSIECALHALANNSIALNVAGGTHHGFADRGEGFCLVNDFGVTANYLLAIGLVSKILIVDLDVHQGNGTAALFRNEPRVFTFSMHGHHNYPFRKENSDLDIGLPDGTGGEAYLETLAKELPTLLDRFTPQLVLYLAGVDVLETDRYGKLKLTQDDCFRRDAYVFSQCRHRNIPAAVSMGGGYSPEIKHIVNAHVNTFRAAFECRP